MTEPNVPHRFELTVEVPGTPEQVWAAIATANGISSWMMPTELEEREGGTVRFIMGETDSVGRITDYDAPRRLVYEEPDWAQLAGLPADTPVTPIVTEFLVEAQSGGTCVVRVVSSAFGTGADWENEFWDDMANGWAPLFDVLRLYLAHFPGQQVTPMWIDQPMDAPLVDVVAAIGRAVGSPHAGEEAKVRDLVGVVEHRSDQSDVDAAPSPLFFLLRATEPVPGFLSIGAYEAHGQAMVMVRGQFFSPNAPAYVEQEQAGWQAWVKELA